MEEQHKKGPLISLVLGSGGTKSLASVAAFDFFNSESIPIDLLLGCSGGGIYCGMHALGYSTQEMLNATHDFLTDKGFSSLDYQTLLSIGKLPGTSYDLSKGLFKGRPALEMCERVFGTARLEDLPIKTLLQATDVRSGKPVILERGALAEAVYASGAMYPLIPPLYMEGRWLADGAFSAPLPVTEAVRRGADIIIAMLFNETYPARPQHFTEGIYHTSRLYSQALMRSQLALAINLHHYEVILIDVNFDRYFAYNDPTHLEEIIQIGKKAMLKRKSDILRAIDQFNHQAL